MAKKILCEFCGKEIPKERLEILPETTCCVECSNTVPYSQDDIEMMGMGSGYENEPANPEDYEFEDNDS